MRTLSLTAAAALLAGCAAMSIYPPGKDPSFCVVSVSGPGKAVADLLLADLEAGKGPPGGLRFLSSKDFSTVGCDVLLAAGGGAPPKSYNLDAYSAHTRYEVLDSYAEVPDHLPDNLWDHFRPGQQAREGLGSHGTPPSFADVEKMVGPSFNPPDAGFGTASPLAAPSASDAAGEFH